MAYNKKPIIETEEWQSVLKYSKDKLLSVKAKERLGRVLLVVLAIFILVLFLPWKQTIPGYGKVTAFLPTNRPQTVENQIGGRIEQWNIREGQQVKKGDTLLVISETNQSYFDPNLPIRLREQLDAKQGNEMAAGQKMDATKDQMSALASGWEAELAAAKNKVTQARNTVEMNEADLVAVQKWYATSRARLVRYEEGFRKGLFSLTDIESRRLKLQEDSAKVVSQVNKLSNARQSLTNAKIDLQNISADYQSSLAKAQSDLSSALSSKVSAQGEIAKLRNEISNVDVRRGLYVVRAPQNGYIVQAKKAGVGETIGAGESIATLQPETHDIAAEIYVDAMHVPLIADSDDVRLEFEGFPSIQFSGWPSVAVGTFAGKVAVIDRVSGEDGKYRLLVIPTSPVPKKDQEWPDVLRQGSGVYGRVLLRSVPVWYEIWRQLNGFPPSLTKKPENAAKTH